MAARLTTYLVVAIVATTLIAGLIVGAQRDDNDGPVDLIVHNAGVYTADGDRTRTEAVAMRGNQILRVGDEEEILRLRRPQTTMIDAGGATVLPGFNDAHTHVIAGGLALDRIDLRDAATLDDVQRRVQTWAEANPDSGWVLGRGWDEQTLTGFPPSRDVLDAIVPDRPVQLISRDGGASWVNSAALRLAGVGRTTPNPPNGTIVRDWRSGHATGILRGSAMSLVGDRIPRVSREERLHAIRAATAEALALGITSMHNAGGHSEEFGLFEEARRAGDLTVRIYSALSIDGEFTNADRAQLLNADRQYPDDPLFKTGAVTIQLDRASAEPGTSGAAAIGPDDLNRSVRLIDAEGWQVMAHAAGERGVRMALNAYQHAVRSNRRSERQRRHRIEHAGAPGSLDARRFGALGVLASVQPLGAFAMRDGIGAWPQSNETAGVRTQSPYDRLVRAGVPVAFGSDWPDGPLDPLLGIRAAVRHMPGSRTAADGAWSDAQRLALEQALDAYTSVAAYASFDEQRKGTLAPGMLADLVVLSEDILDGPSRLANARVEITIFDGKVVYRRDRGTN